MKKAKGQALVEFTLILPLFIALITGLLDGTRLLFDYNSLQESARVGARWAAVEVGRDCWGTFAAVGNNASTTDLSTLIYTPTGCSSPVSTIAGEVASKLVAIPHDQIHVIFNVPSGGTNDQSPADTLYVKQKVSVEVDYIFHPILAFGRVGIHLSGKAVSYHE